VFSHFEGKDFFSLEADCEATQKRILTLPPQRNQKGMCILQPWVPAFNPDKPQDLFIPTWITLRKLPREYLKIASQIAEQVGTLIGCDPDNSYKREPRFCVGLRPGEGWEPEVTIKTKSGLQISVIIDYDNLPIRCRYCWSTKHQVKNCDQLNEIKAKTQGRKAPQTTTTQAGESRRGGEQKHKEASSTRVPAHL
jgi:hypothetical protein